MPGSPSQHIDITRAKWIPYIDNSAFGAVDSNNAISIDIIDPPTTLTDVHSGMATVNIDGASDFGVTSPCTCAFLDWGVWSVNYVTAINTQKRFHLAGWVAGELADLTSGVLANQPTGTATYLGHMYGTVLNSGSIYTASGTYQNVWNFDTDTGAVSLTNFDGLATFTGTATALSNAREFTTGTISNGAGFSAQVRGSFVKSTTDNTAGHMGDFHILGSSYKAAGILFRRETNSVSQPTWSYDSNLACKMRIAEHLLYPAHLFVVPVRNGVDIQEPRSSRY